MTIEGASIPLGPAEFKTGSIGFRAQRANLSIDGKLYWLSVTLVEQGTRKAISSALKIEANLEPP